ncbi:MAG TPA: hypothetical protein VJ812_10810, partial [Gemmatimonadaceae bacterium]|nr:hypothetical protein [Gemmatimonadaceae bacterium]
MANVLAFAETRSGALRKVGLETVTAARALADATGGEVHALIVGPPGVGTAAERLGQHGADVVLVCEHPGFAPDNPEAAAAVVADRLASGYRAALFAAT